MKTLSSSWFTFLFAFTFFQFFNTNKSEEAYQKAIAYKQQNTISCGAKRAPYNGTYLFTNPPFSAWSYNVHLFDNSSYNPLFIPDTLSGTDFTLRIHDTTAQFLGGLATATSAYNNNSILGPTLIFNKGATVQMHVTNQLTDSTTVHWHGIHLPAIMDGGPHQIVAPNTQWDPTWVVKNNAATYWYHPHLHMKTSQQLVQGLGGLIIVRDDKESTLNLPRTYGVDDIPLILNDKRFESGSNQFVLSRYGDTMMCNGTLNAQYNVPAQVVRFRVLNAAPERCYNIGFSNDQSFSVIAGDGGLLNAPVAVTRYILAPGERIEILVNLSSLQDQSIVLRSFNASLPTGIAGSEPDSSTTASILRNKLGARDFDILKLNIVSPTFSPVTTIPATLVQNETIDSTQAALTRTIKITQAGLACPDPSTRCAWFNKQMFDMNRIDYKVTQDDIEIWSITNNSIIAHPFHIHDVSFKILSKSDGPVPEYEKGWKDVILVKVGQTIRFIAKFSDYADSVHPYMYHCHMTFHEDEGMMGQFVVIPKVVTPSINITKASITEGNSGTSQINFTVTLSAPTTQPVSVTYQTKNGTATAPTDFTATAGTLTFAPGETIKTINVAVNGDTSPESNETFKLLLKNPTNATLAVKSAKGTIVNDDVAVITYTSVNSINNKSDIKVFPNPVSNGMLNIKFPLIFKDALQLVVTDAKGVVVMNQKINAGTVNMQLPVSTLKSGMYFLLLFSNKDVVYKQQVEVLHSY